MSTCQYLCGETQLIKICVSNMFYLLLFLQLNPIFIQLGFSVSEVTDKSPVEYWFMKTEAQVFIQKTGGLIKTKWN